MSVPKILHQMWTPVGTLPIEVAQMMSTWREHHPTWEYVYWTEKNMIPLANQDLWNRAHQISPHASEQFQSDVARYEILLHHGGVWVDADFICQRPIDALMDAEIWAGQVANVLNNALFAAPVGHPMLFDLVAKLPTNVARHSAEVGNTVKSGPQYFTPIARKHQITEYPQRFFYPFDWTELDSDAEGVYATHMWGNARRQKGLAWKS